MLSGIHILCGFMLCRSFCTPGREIVSRVISVCGLTSTFPMECCRSLILPVKFIAYCMYPISFHNDTTYN